MNIVHLKYAVEVEKAKSVNKAAENLYMGQPNLSRAIKELEDSLGITIFKRTSRGMTTTPEGEEFLSYAHKILEQVDEVEDIYRMKKYYKKRFSLSCPRASYISSAMTEFSKQLGDGAGYEIYYKETNSSETISNIIHNDYKLGIIRYQQAYETYFHNLLREKELENRTVTDFKYLLAASADSPLFKNEEITAENLKDYTEIAHADPYIPSLSMVDVMKKEFINYTDKRIYVYERASQLELLSQNKMTYMWVSPISREICGRYGLKQVKCRFHDRLYKDILIYKKGYAFSDLDNLFIDALCAAKRDIVDEFK